YIYTAPGTHNKDSYDLSSLGVDGVESADDVTNWESDAK
ncbi:MAG: type II secretion system protein GspG, partial [Candidatus Omnitrophica bacterium]|nr:type II secretion system protein GspG [Candidatus Omnitrophota bacterium]